MPTGVYQRASEINGRKLHKKVCQFCSKDYLASYGNHKKSKFCSLSCSAKSRPEFVYGMLGKTTSDKQKAVVKSRTGEKHQRWIKDRDKVAKSEKKHLDTKYKIWAKSVKERDKWICQLKDDECSGRLESHHILRWKDYPKLRYEIGNGITLCQNHHPLKKSEEERLAPIFREILTLT